MIKFWLRAGWAVTAGLGVGAVAAPPPAAVSVPLYAEGAPLSEALRQKLPDDLRAAAAQWLHLEPRQQKALLGLTEGDLQSFVLDAMAQVPQAENFVLEKLPAQPRSGQIALLGIMLVDPAWRRRPGLPEKLEEAGAATADSDLAVRYFEAARRLQTHHLRLLLQRRIEAARARADEAEEDRLATLDEYWMKLEEGAMLPGFLSNPPPLFSLVPAERSIRLVALGDFGEGTAGQRMVAASIRQAARDRAFDFGLTLGDNFYPKGMPNLEDPRWRDWWEKLYGPLGIRFYATLGNHDWYDPDSPAAEILYTQRSPSWRMPAEYYTFAAGPVQFFALDTNDIAEAQAVWLRRALAASKARWKVVYGHHPIFTALDAYYTAYMRERLWPLIRGKADVYLSGHQHAMVQLKPQDGVHFWVSGGGGAHLHSVQSNESHTEMAAATFGYAVMEADPNRLSVTLYDGNNRRLDGDTLRK